MIYIFWPGNTNGPKLTTPRHAVDRDYYSRSKQPFASILSVMGNVHAPLLDKQQLQIKDILTGGVYHYPSPPPGFDFPICLVFLNYISAEVPCQLDSRQVVPDTFSLQPQ